ncbi:RNMT family protein [Megaselia abdita]
MSDSEGSGSEQRARKRPVSRSPSPDGGIKRIAGENSSVVQSHYNELKESGLAERSKSRIFHMRNFNNWVKSMFLNEFLGKIKNSQKLGEHLRVLDMCCGKGGDLLKYEKAQITHLICTDIADVSIEQCKVRYDQMKGGRKFTAEFIACDSTLVRLREKYKDPSMKLNLVSCQFAFHYCFESLSQADCMARNASECLQPGGYFIATIPDANEIMRRQRLANENSFGNSVYNIEFCCDTENPPLFGAKYQFHLEGVVDCPEFLVYFPLLEELCKKYGLKLVRKTSFADYFHENKESGKMLLQRMNALESYPNKGRPLFGDDSEYEHAKNNKLGNIRTLSKSEWEATSLYLVCAFQKCKNTWDANGKPVYEFD